jgi:hypothetical protein
MGMLDFLLGKKAGSAPTPRNSRPAQHSVQFEASQMSPQSVNSTRKDVLRLVLREMLTRNGIPQPWITADMLRTTSSKRQEGLDPQARNWLTGFSWQFALDDLSECPPLPHPGSWTAPPPAPQASEHGAPLTKPADIIEGPVVIPRTTDEVRADLEQLLALRDADQQRHRPGGDHFAATRPANL